MHRVPMFTAAVGLIAYLLSVLLASSEPDASAAAAAAAAAADTTTMAHIYSVYAGMLLLLAGSAL
jgi:hypothetical protein